MPVAPAIYARISDDRTGEALGVQRQIEKCRERAQDLGWPGPRVYIDNDVSAYSGKRRSAFEELLVDIESRAVDGVVAWHLDRVLRRVTDLERVLDAIESQRSAVPVVFVQAGEIDLTTHSGILLARILAAVAANESGMKSERLRAQRAQHAHSGQAHGPLGYGYDENRHVIPEEAAIIREVASRIIDGDPLYAIATDLNERHVLTPAHGRWDARRVAKVVERGERAELIAVIEALRARGPLTATTVAKLLNRAGADPKQTAAGVKVAAASRASQRAGRATGTTWLDHAASDDHGVDDSTIALVLTDAGVQPDRTYWRSANLRAMVRRGSLAGWREFSPGERGGRGEMVAQGDWTPILSKETVEEIRKVTDRVGARKKGRPPKYLLAGVLKCGICGSSLGGSTDGRGGVRYQCSQQPGRRACGGLTITGTTVDLLVSAAVVDTLADARVRAGAKRRGAVSDRAVQEAEQEITEIEELRAAYASEAASGDLRPDEWRAVREGLDRRQREAERVMGAWAPNLRAVLSDVPQRRGEIEAWWETASMARRQQVVRTLIERIDVAPRGRSGNRFDPSRLGEPVWRV